MKTFIIFSIIIVLCMFLPFFHVTGTQNEHHYCGTCGVRCVQKKHYFFMYVYRKKEKITKTMTSTFLLKNYPKIYKKHKHQWRLIGHDAMGKGCVLGYHRYNWFHFASDHRFVVFLREVQKIDPLSVPYLVKFFLNYTPQEDKKKLLYTLQDYKKLASVIQKTRSHLYSRYYEIMLTKLKKETLRR